MPSSDKSPYALTSVVFIVLNIKRKKKKKKKKKKKNIWQWSGPEEKER